MTNIKRKLNKGFTLVELMVATSIFVIIMMIGIGSLTTASNAASASRKLRTAVDNVNFAMESITREARMGTFFKCVQSGGEMGNLASFDDYGGVSCPIFTFTGQAVYDPITDTNSLNRMGYYIDDRGDDTYGIKKCVNSSLPDDCNFIISKDVNITDIRFFVNGSDPNDGIQPSVRIIVKGEIDIKGDKAAFYLQSMASQRSSEK